MTDKLLYVSCHIPQSRVWELLRLLEVAKCGNVEVRPVAPTTQPEPPDLSDGASKIFSKRKKMKEGRATGVRKAVANVMTLNEVRRPYDVAIEIGANPKSVYSALSAGVQQGIYKKRAKGFERVKADE